MNTTETDPDDDIKALFDSDVPASAENIGRQRRKCIARAKASLAQRDAILFAFVKIWTVLADILAPIFASLAVKQAGTYKASDKNKDKSQ